LSSGVKESFDYWLKWIANVCKSKKNNAVPYLKGPQGIGKSFLSEMLQRHVLGMAILMKSSAEPFLSRFIGYAICFL
jgi:pantothenate kinase-related protein Tda10